MKKVDLIKLLNGILDGICEMHPILIGQAGLYLLCLSVLSPAENSHMEDYAFIVGLACVLYAGGKGVAKLVADHKARKVLIEKYSAKLAEIQRRAQSQNHSKVK